MAAKAGTGRYTPVEKEVFLDLLQTHKDIIENKKSDTVTIKKKEETWCAIADAYNSASVVIQPRTVQQLKKWWANLKQMQRSAKTSERQSVLATGGGPAAPAASVDPQIEAIAPHLMVRAPCIFSSDLTDEQSEEIAAQVEEGVVLHGIPENTIMMVLPQDEVEVEQPAAESSNATSARQKPTEAADPRVELALKQMREIHELKLNQMKAEFERKEAHARRIEELELETARKRLKVEEIRLAQLTKE